MLFIPQIQVEQITLPAIEVEMAKLDFQKIDVNNWPDQFPYSPDVKFKVAHDGKNLFIQFFVKEKEILAKAKGNNSEVWTDSCVEFFISLDDSGHYYNLEQSCIGEVLLAYRKSKTEAWHAEDDVIAKIKNFPSLGRENFDLKEGEFEWSLLTVIPVEAFWKSDIKSFSGLKAKANFYKCGDNMKNPHYLSWAPIGTETPNFHKPECFKELQFGE